MRKRIILSFVALMLCIGMTCTAQAAEKVLLAWTPNIGTLQIDVAVERGYFKEQGLDVEVVAFPSGREAFEALAGGQIDISIMSEIPAAIGMVREQPFVLLGDLSRYSGYRMIASAKATKLESMQDLAGKKVGTTLGTNAAYYLSSVIKQTGVKVDVVNVAGSELVPALVRGDIVAASMFSAYYDAAQRALGPDYKELKIGTYSSHFIVAGSSKAVKNRPEMVEKVMAAIYKADKDAKANTKDAIAIVVKNLKGAATKEAFEKLWVDLDFGLSLDASLIDLLHAQGEWVSVTNLGKKQGPPREAYVKYVDVRFFEKVTGKKAVLTK